MNAVASTFPVLGIPPMPITTTMNAVGVGGVVAVAGAGTYHSHNPLPQSINYEQLYLLLSEYSSRHSGSVTIPTSHPTSFRIADILSSLGVERVLDARWNAQLDRVSRRQQQQQHQQHGEVVATTAAAAAAAQYTQYGYGGGGGGSLVNDNCNGTNNYEEEYDTTTTDWFHEQRRQYHCYQHNLPNSLTSTRYHQLQTTLPQYFPNSNNPSTSTTMRNIIINTTNYSISSNTTTNNNNTNNSATEASSSSSTPHSTIVLGTKWEARLHELIHYQSQHGHTNVPLDHPSLLGIWVKNQRDTYHYDPSSMSPARIAALDSIQFDWNIWGHQRLQVHQDAWDAMYNKLVEYMKKHGHGNVSQHAGKRKNRQCVVGGGEDDDGVGSEGDGGGGVREGDEDLEEEERLGKWIKNQLSTCETSSVGIFVASSL